MNVPKRYTRLLMRAAPLMNAPVAAIANSPGFGRIIGRNVALISYTGRRSGRPYRLPVAYRRSGDELEIAANMPDAINCLVNSTLNTNTVREWRVLV